MFTRYSTTILFGLLVTIRAFIAPQPPPSASPPVLWQANWARGLQGWTIPTDVYPKGWSIQNGMLFYVL